MTELNSQDKPYPTIMEGFGLTVAIIIVSAIIVSGNVLLNDFFSKELSFSITYSISMGLSLLFAYLISKKRNGGNLKITFRNLHPQVIFSLVILTFLIQIGITAPIISFFPISDFYRKIFIEMSEMNGVLTLIRVC
jgi:hypothetical protein